MVDPILYAAAATPCATAARRLKAVQVAHYVWGGMLVLPFGLLLLLSLCILPFHSMLNERGRENGLTLALLMLLASAVATGAGCLTIYSGRCIARRRCLQFSRTWSLAWAAVGLVVAAYELMRVASMHRAGIAPVRFRGALTVATVFAVGAVLALLSFCVLSRDPTAALYAAAEEKTP